MGRRWAAMRNALQVFANDSVRTAMGLINEYGVDCLPVVDEHDGRLLFEVSRVELLTWPPVKEDAPLSEILSARLGIRRQFLH